MIREGEDTQLTASSEWPLTLSAAWCGEWIDQKYSAGSDPISIKWGTSERPMPQPGGLDQPGKLA